MQRFENLSGITKTVYDYPVSSYCTIGKDYYTGNLHIEIEMGDYYVNFDDVHKFLERDLNGIHAAAEELVGIVFDKFKEAYQPKGIIIEYSFLTPPTTKIVKTWRADEE